MTGVLSCTTGGPSPHVDSDTREVSDQSNQEDEAEKQELTADEIAAALPHPQKPTAWHTRTLVTTAEQPVPAKIHACLETLAAVAAEAGDARGMQLAVEAARGLVERDPNVAHWCFYQNIVQLDDRLAAPGDLLTTKADVFFAVMRGEWILARALDELTDEDRYFPYIRARYVQISADVFGRAIEVVPFPGQ